MSVKCFIQFKHPVKMGTTTGVNVIKVTSITITISSFGRIVYQDGFVKFPGATSDDDPLYFNRDVIAFYGPPEETADED